MEVGGGGIRVRRKGDERMQVIPELSLIKSGVSSYQLTTCFIWSRHGDSNPGPADYESAALPLSYAGLAFILAASGLFRNAPRWSGS